MAKRVIARYARGRASRGVGQAREHHNARYSEDDVSGGPLAMMVAMNEEKQQRSAT